MKVSDSVNFGYYNNFDKKNKEWKKTVKTFSEAAGNVHDTENSGVTQKPQITMISKEESTVTDFLKRNPQYRAEVERQVAAGKAVQQRGVSLEEKAAMTKEEYKIYFKGLMSSIPKNPSQIGDTEITNISDKGWEQMQKDSEYEAWVLGYTVIDRSVNIPFGMQYKSVHIENFGASIDEHHGVSYGTGELKGAKGLHAKNDEKNRRAKRRKEVEKQKVLMKQLAKRRAESEERKQNYFNDMLSQNERLHNFLTSQEGKKTSNPHGKYNKVEAISVYEMMQMSIDISKF